MAKSENHDRLIGDYVLQGEIGSGSFAVVWKAVHREDGHEVAIKEIATEKLNKKLWDNLSSEIAILGKTNHPNIIRLFEVVEAPSRLYLVLEYCAGGDLAAYLQEHGRVTQEVARRFMCQLGAGLQVLRANDWIHRDLKPQNLLLSTKNQNAVLKIADFGFARSLQPQGMADTLCGSPLYMAPEILQCQKYDAKADLWSVGAIFFQLLTGRPPFIGNNHAQLLQNITRSEVRFSKSIEGELHPDCIDLCRKLLRRNPVERLSFEEFFHHSFLGLFQAEAEAVKPFRAESAISESYEKPQDSLPFRSDEEHQEKLGFPSGLSKASSFSPISRSISSPLLSSMISHHTTKGARLSREQNPSKKMAKRKTRSRCHQGFQDNQRMSSSQTLLAISNFQRSTETVMLESSTASTVIQVTDENCIVTREKVNPLAETTGMLVDSMEDIEDYVLVNGSMDSLSLSQSTSAAGIHCSQGISNLQRSPSKLQISPVLMVGTVFGGFSVDIGSAGSHGSTCSIGYLESLDSAGLFVGPSTDTDTRLSSLRQSAQLITELANDKLNSGQSLQALSIQLVCLAIWKETLKVCYAWAANANNPLLEELGNISQKILGSHAIIRGSAHEESLQGGSEVAAAMVCSEMEQEFLLAVDFAEHVASLIDSKDGSVEMPDGTEIIFQAALTLGRMLLMNSWGIFQMRAWHIQSRPCFYNFCSSKGHLCPLYLLWFLAILIDNVCTCMPICLSLGRHSVHCKVMSSCNSQSIQALYRTVISSVESDIESCTYHFYAKSIYSSVMAFAARACP